MIVSERLYPVWIIVWVLLLTETSCSIDLEKYCPKDAIVDLEGSRSVIAGVVYKSGGFFRSNETWVKNDTTYGCPCLLKVCVPSCCPLEYALSDEGDCIEDELTPQIIRLRSELSNPEYHEFTSNPCKSVKNGFDNFSIHRDGSIRVPDIVRPFPVGSYCLLRRLNSTVREALVCRRQSTDLGWSYWIVVCLSAAIIFMMLTFVVYSVVPELKNLQGWIVRSYLASYICLMAIMTAFAVISKLGFDFNKYQLMTLVAGLIYFGFASMMWLNVMSFDIWRKFRGIQPIHDINFKKRQRVTFIRYSIYTWITSCVLPLVWLSSQAWESYVSLSTANDIIIYSTVALILLCFICNICFYTMTALKIKQCKKETADMVDEASKHHRKNKQWFNIYLKLFVIMGCHVILWAVVWAWKNNTFMILAYFAEPVQSILIFLIFVWKDDVLSSLREQLARMLRKLRYRLQRDPTPDI